MVVTFLATMASCVTCLSGHYSGCVYMIYMLDSRTQLVLVVVCGDQKRVVEVVFVVVVVVKSAYWR